MNPVSQPDPKPRTAARDQRWRWAEAEAHLKTVDVRWHPIIERHGPCRLRPRTNRFGVLVRAILGQQISAKAASSVNKKLLALQNAQQHRPDPLLHLGFEGIREAGVSGVKTRYLLNLAEAVNNGSLTLNQIGRLSDQEIVKRLTEIPGIGPWTAEMFLIFALNRPDVLPLGDLGVRVGLRDHYGLAEVPTPNHCIELAEPWRPYRTVAMWYLWNVQDAAPPIGSTAES